MSGERTDGSSIFDQVVDILLPAGGDGVLRQEAVFNLSQKFGLDVWVGMQRADVEPVLRQYLTDPEKQLNEESNQSEEQLLDAMDDAVANSLSALSSPPMPPRIMAMPAEQIQRALGNRSGTAAWLRENAFQLANTTLGFIVNVIASPVDMFKPEAISSSSTYLAISDARLAIRTRATYQSAARSSDIMGLKSKLSSKRRIAEFVSNSLFSQMGFALTLTKSKVLGVGYILPGASSHVLGSSAAVALTGPIIVAAAGAVSAAFHFNAAYRAELKSNPHILLEDRFKKYEVLKRNASKLEAKEAHLQEQRMLNQMLALEQHIKQHSISMPDRTQLPGESSAHFDLRNRRAKSGYKRAFHLVQDRVEHHNLHNSESSQVSPNLIPANLAEYLISKQKAKAKQSAKNGLLSLTTSVAGVFSALAAAGLTGPAGAVVLFAATGAYATYKLYRSFRQAQYKKALFNAAITQFAQAGHPKVKSMIEAISQNQDKLVELNAQLKQLGGGGRFSKIRVRFSLNKDKRQKVKLLRDEIKKLEADIKGSRAELNNLTVDAIVRQRIGLANDANVLEFISKKDRGRIVNEYVAQNVAAAKAILKSGDSALSAEENTIKLVWESDVVSQIQPSLTGAAPAHHDFVEVEQEAESRTDTLFAPVFVETNVATECRNPSTCDGHMDIAASNSDIHLPLGIRRHVVSSSANTQPALHGSGAAVHTTGCLRPSCGPGFASVPTSGRNHKVTSVNGHPPLGIRMQREDSSSVTLG